jgi:transcription elongation factor GreA
VLRQELEHLKSVMRPAESSTAIAEARAHGDLRENAEYHAAREQQGFTEGRINELESVLSFAEVIDVATLNAGDKVVFGRRSCWRRGIPTGGDLLDRRRPRVDIKQG